MKKILKYLLLIAPIVILILMLLPKSISMVSLAEGGKEIVEYGSYYEISVFGKGNIFALPALVMVLIFLGFVVADLFKHQKNYNVIINLTAVGSFILIILSSFLTGNPTIYQYIMMGLCVIEGGLLFYKKFTL